LKTFSNLINLLGFTEQENQMKTKLIMVEGIPGSGKTSTAQYVRDWAASKGLTPLLFLEDAPNHPVDLDTLSFFDTEQYHSFTAQFEDYQPIIEKISKKGRNGYFVHYRRWGEITSKKIPNDLAEVLYGHDAHDTLHPEKYYALMVERWQRFGVEPKNNEEVIIFECCFFQNPFTIFIGKHNYDPEMVKSTILELAESVQALNPSLIVLQGKSVQGTLQRVIEERPKEWIQGVERYVTQQGYGKQHHLVGMEGVITFYQMMQDMETDIASQLEWNKLIIDNSNWDWEEYLREIDTFLNTIL